MIPDLRGTLRMLLEQVPSGRVATYGDLANALGNRAAARWVGEYLLNHPHDANCPCHRIVRSNGELGLFISGCSRDQQIALERESISLRQGKVDLESRRFTEFVSDRPLEKLAAWQEHLATRVTCRSFRKEPRTIAGVDVSYNRLGEALAAYCFFEVGSAKCLWSTVSIQTTTFPYIPGFLAFRELPALLEVVRAAAQQGYEPDLLFVDGSGILHPRRAGIATCLGVLTGHRTIGVSKKLLCGRLQEKGASSTQCVEILYAGRVSGMAIRGSGKFPEVFVSPGHRIDVPGAVRMTRQAFHGHRLPEPVFQADKLSRAVAQGKLEGGPFLREQRSPY